MLQQCDWNKHFHFLLVLYAIATELYVVLLLLLAPEPGAYVKFYVFGVVGFWFCWMYVCGGGGGVAGRSLISICVCLVRAQESDS